MGGVTHKFIYMLKPFIFINVDNTHFHLPTQTQNLIEIHPLIHSNRELELNQNKQHLQNEAINLSKVRIQMLCKTKQSKHGIKNLKRTKNRGEPAKSNQLGTNSNPKITNFNLEIDEFHVQIREITN